MTEDLALTLSNTDKITVQATSKKNVKLNLQLPANQTVVTESFVELAQIGSPLMKQVMGPMSTVR